MSALALLQQRFLLRMQGAEVPETLADIAPGRMPSGVGLRIYRHAYGARLREALENDHPVLGSYLGDSLWDTLCHGYIDKHPSHCRSLRDFGAALPGYLARCHPFAGHPELAELAAFERALLSSFDAADAVPAPWHELTARSPTQWPQLSVRLHPSLQVHLVALNSVEIWRAVKAGTAPPAPGPAHVCAWAAWRDEDRVSRFRSLDDEEQAALAHFMNGGNFAGLCELLTRWHPADAVPATALGLLHAWCTAGWVASWQSFEGASNVDES